MSNPIEIHYPKTSDWFAYFQDKRESLVQMQTFRKVRAIDPENTANVAKILFQEKLILTAKKELFLTFQLAFILQELSLKQLNHLFSTSLIEVLSSEFEVAAAQEQHSIVCANHAHKGTPLACELLHKKSALRILPDVEHEIDSFKKDDFRAFDLFTHHFFADISLFLQALHTQLPLPTGQVYITLEGMSKKTKKN